MIQMAQANASNSSGGVGAQQGSLNPQQLLNALQMASNLKRRREGGRIRVLSVDDDPVNQLVIQNLLAPQGYEVGQDWWEDGRGRI